MILSSPVLEVLASEKITHMTLATRMELIAIEKLKLAYPGLTFVHLGKHYPFDILAFDGHMPVMAIEVKSMNYLARYPKIAMHKNQIARKKKFIRKNKILGWSFKPVMLAIDWITHEVRTGKGLKCWSISKMDVV
jgi:hypothetical protein